MVSLRKATVADGPAVCAVHRASALALGRNHYSPDELDAWVVHLVPDLYTEAIAAGELIVAEIDGTVVGVAQLDQGKAVIELLYVSPDRAGQGVGTRLLGVLEAGARSSGLRVLRLDASLNSVGFYERRGYQAESAGLHRTRAGREVRCVHMRKDLAPEPGGDPHS